MAFLLIHDERMKGKNNDDTTKKKRKTLKNLLKYSENKIIV